MVSELSPSAAERARKAFAAVLQSMQDPGTQRNVALALGVSESTVSRTKATLEDAIALLYQLGFKVVESSRVCVDRARFEAMVTMASAAMADEQTVRRLTWDE